MITTYRKTITKISAPVLLSLRSILGPSSGCFYETGCTQYAIDAVENNNVMKAVYLIAIRLLSCNPLYQVYKKVTIMSVLCFALIIPSVTPLYAFTTKTVTVSSCNAEKIRSTNLLIKLINMIKDTCTKHQSCEPKLTVTATPQGLSLICLIDQPRIHIILAALNDTNTIHCSVSADSISKTQKRSIKEAIAKIICCDQ